jgi:hypothetical protein
MKNPYTDTDDLSGETFPVPVTKGGVKAPYGYTRPTGPSSSVWEDVKGGLGATEAPDATGTGGTAASGPGRNAAAFAGFDFARAQDPSKSAKDAFAGLAGNASWLPQSKEDAERWFREFILQGLLDQGYQVYGVTGDQARIGTRENPGGETIDFLQNAGGANPMLAWQSNMAGGPNVSTGGTAGGAFSQTGAMQGMDPLVQQMVLGLARNTPHDLTRDALLALMQAGQGQGG